MFWSRFSSASLHPCGRAHRLGCGGDWIGSTDDEGRGGGWSGQRGGSYRDKVGTEMPLFLKSSNSLILQTWISIRRRDTGRARCGITRLKVAQNRLPPHLCLFTFHLYYQRLYTQAHTKNESDNTNKRTWRIKRAPNVTLARVPSGILFPSVDAQITHLQTKP